MEACCHFEGKESYDLSGIEDRVTWLVHSKSQLKGASLSTLASAWQVCFRADSLMWSGLVWTVSEIAGSTPCTLKIVL